ncbi:hypothetical protein LTR08_002354 [Meristemomyces frigidus]|nr:hypothetical protein LTR08_002354 [Meristemomyces frigidus]
MSDLNCYITTFNCGRSLIDVDYFAANLFNGAPDLPPDFIVLCLQEIAPLGYSFLGGSMLAPYFARFTQAVYDATESRFGEDSRYASVIVREVGMTAIMVFTRHQVQPRIRWVETGGVGVGVWEMGNKGAVGVRVGVSGSESSEETRLSFVAAHLAPMEGKWQRRNEDWRSICENLVFERIPTVGEQIEAADPAGEGESEPLLSAPDEATSSSSTPGTMFDPPSHLFFAGDLNYRTADQPPSPNDPKSWPQPVETPSDPQHYSNLLSKDQLTREQSKGNTLHHLAEAPVDFPPTYKYSTAAQKHVAHTTRSRKRTQADGRVNEITYVKPQGDEEDVWLWAEHRVPSWCDRILFLEEARPTVHSYTALPVQPTSDHRPVALSCSVSRKLGDVSVPSRFKVRRDWKERRAAARRYELLVGAAAYLGLTWEGEALLAGTIVGIIGGYLILHALLAT